MNYTFTVDFTVPDHVTPADIKDAVGAAIRTFQTHNPNIEQQKILAGLRLRPYPQEKQCV